MDAYLHLQGVMGERVWQQRWLLSPRFHVFAEWCILLLLPDQKMLVKQGRPLPKGFAVSVTTGLAQIDGFLSRVSSADTTMACVERVRFSFLFFFFLFFLIRVTDFFFDRNIKGSKERCLLEQKHNLRIFGVIRFIELQNDT